MIPFIAPEHPGTPHDIIVTAQAAFRTLEECGDISKAAADHACLLLANVMQQIHAPAHAPTCAADFLAAAGKHMRDRASTYDKAAGERSMGKTVAAFNIIADQYLTEEQGWLLMGILKMVRSQQGAFKADNYEDEAAYAALRGECATRERTQ